MRKKLFFIVVTVILFSSMVQANGLPNGFVYLRNIDPTIEQDMRYASYHNFVGHPIQGYNADECILTLPAATALAKIQKILRQKNYSLKVYDCYRPQQATNDFIRWSRQVNQQQMKTEFYPRVDKKNFFKLGYVAAQSNHTHGSTVDLTIVSTRDTYREKYLGQTLVSCFADYDKRFHDGSIDMGTGYDCMDERAHGDSKNVNQLAQKNRFFLRGLMEQYGFVSYPKEWWHFTLKNQSWSNVFFNFSILPISTHFNIE